MVRRERVLVTGGAGYIGSILVPTLLDAGYEVTVLDNFMYGQTSLLDVAADERLEIVRGDVRDERLVRELLREADAVIPPQGRKAAYANFRSGVVPVSRAQRRIGRQTARAGGVSGHGSGLREKWSLAVCGTSILAGATLIRLGLW